MSHAFAGLWPAKAVDGRLGCWQVLTSCTTQHRSHVLLLVPVAKLHVVKLVQACAA
jgi:hypothetical protein